MELVLNINPLNSKVVRGHTCTKQLSNTDIVNKFLELSSSTKNTPILPTNCIQYIRKNHSYIVVQEFEPSVVDIQHTISEADIDNDMIHFRHCYTARCDGFDPDEDNNCCFNSFNGSCACSCDYRSFAAETVDGYSFDDDVLFEAVPTPRLLFVSVLGSQGEHYFMRKSFIKALSSPLTNYSDIVFDLPVGNVYENSKICWGGNLFEPSRNIMFLSSIFTRFYSTSFNSDLDYVPSAFTKLKKLLKIPYFSTRNFLSAISHKPEFNLEWVTLFNEGRESLTYEQFINSIIDEHTI